MVNILNVVIQSSKRQKKFGNKGDRWVSESAELMPEVNAGRDLNGL